MGTGASSLAMTGLTHNVGKRESARQDLATMGQLVQMKKQQEQEEQQAALLEQQYYEQIRKEADQMLAGDRKKINEKSKNLQGQIREQIKAFGGSRAKFMASGGMAMLGDYTRGVLESKEVATYRENQKNLTELLDIKKKGLGHLLSSRDHQSLEEYNRNGTGTITYSGLKNEVKMPDEESFLFGTYATPTQILFNEENYLKILGNHKIDNPNWVEPDTGKTIEELPLDKQQEVLRAYTAAQGWTVRGKKMPPQQAYSDGTGTGNKTGKPTSADMVLTQSGNITSVMVYDNKPIGIEDMNNPAMGDNEFLNATYGGVKYQKRATIEPTLGETFKTLGFAQLFNWEQNNGFAPRGASAFTKSMNVPLFKTQNGEDYDIQPGGIIKGFVPKDRENFLLANGVPIKGEDMAEGDYTITGSFIGYEMNGKNGDYMVVDAYDIDGKLDEERNANLYKTDGAENESETKGKRAMYIALKDPKGNEYYQKVNYTGLAHQNDLATYIGADADDLSDQYKENDYKRDLRQALGEGVNLATVGQAVLDVPNELFDNNVDFQAMVNVYNRYGGGRYRENLMKGFYMANLDFATDGDSPDPNISLDGMINQNSFGMLLSSLGLENRLEDTRITDTELLDLMENRILSETHSETDPIKAKNKLLITKIRNYMNKARMPGKPKS